MTVQPDKYSTPYERGRIRTVERLLPTGPGRALDLGCGTGVISARLSDKGFAVTGVDVDRSALEEAARNVPSATFKVANLLSDALPAGPFDVITACEVLEHFGRDDQRLFLEQVRSRLAPHGHLILSTPNTMSLMSAVGSVIYPLRGRRWDCGDATHQYVHTSWSLQALLRRCGFQVQQQLGFQLLTHRPQSIARLGMRAFSGTAAWFCYDSVVDATPLRT